MYEYLDRRYALAFYQIAKEKNVVPQYLSEFREVTKLLTTNDELIQIVKSPQLSKSRKKELVKSIFTDQVSEDLVSILEIMVDKNRLEDISGILSELEKINLESNNILVAHVKTVISLDDVEKKELINKLSTKYNKEIMLEEEIDKSIIGGVYLKIGDDIIDGTLKDKLQQMKKVIKKGKLDVLKE